MEKVEQLDIQLMKIFEDAVIDIYLSIFTLFLRNESQVEQGDTARFCSYPRQTPYMLINFSLTEDKSSHVYTSYYLFNLRSEKIIKITHKLFSKRIVSPNKFMLLGTSRSWAVIMGLYDSIILLSDVFNPWSSESSPITISLPPLAFTGHLKPHFQMPINVALSTPYPDNDNDYIVSVIFYGSKLCYCMPNRDSEWTTINIPFSCDIDSHVLYSRKDQKFYLLTTGCAYMAALDLKNNKNPNFLRLQLENFPSIPQHEWEILDSCSRSDYIAESSSGERFIVHWYVTYVKQWGNGNRISVFGKTKRFMVFKKEEEDKYQGRKMIANYTESIGDLCIFIEKNETFCLEASKYPGLKSNSIYYLGYGYNFGIYDISNRIAREYDISDFPTVETRYFLSPPLH